MYVYVCMYIAIHHPHVFIARAQYLAHYIMLKAVVVFLPTTTGSSRYLLISLQLLVLSIAIVYSTSTVTVCACVKACSNSSDT